MFPGWVVANLIPPHVVLGLVTGQYTLHGGVVRWAAGTANAGQIVLHLLPFDPTNLLTSLPGLDFIPGIGMNMQTEQLKEVVTKNIYQFMQTSKQISSLPQTAQNILQIAKGTAILSGLGLAVTTISFVVINNKLSTIDNRLKEIQKDVQAIRYFLESSERAKLYAALNAILKIDAKTPIEHRHTILHNSRNTLAEINMRYREILSEANAIENAMAAEEYFCLTGLAHARCTAELGMLNIAYKEIEEINNFWQLQCKRIAQKVLISDYPERFLATDFVEDVSITDLMEWLDFVYGEKKGFLWIDELRRKIDESWYSKNWLNKGGSGLNRNVGIGLEKEKQMVIPSLRKLVARSEVLQGYVAQYEMLEAQNLKPSEFEQKINEIPKSSAVDGYFILESEKKSRLFS